MREYRDELQSAHERIARLEDELARARATRRSATVASLYQTKAGPFRVVVHRMDTGNEIGHAIVPRSTEGSYLEAFGFDGDDVIVAID